mgnify:CR=1 FL=1
MDLLLAMYYRVEGQQFTVMLTIAEHQISMVSKFYLFSIIVVFTFGVLSAKHSTSSPINQNLCTKICPYFSLL